MENQEENQLKNNSTEAQGKKAPYPGLAVALVAVAIITAAVVVGSLAYSCIVNFS